jgi:Domain of unknown function (DUF1877)
MMTRVGVTMQCLLSSPEQLAEVRAHPATLMATLEERWIRYFVANAVGSPADFLNLEEAFAGLYWLLAGDDDDQRPLPWPAAGAVFGGEPLDPAGQLRGSVAFGLSPRQVQDVSAHLAAHPFDRLVTASGEAARTEMFDYYGDIGPDLFDGYLRPAYANLVTFFGTAAWNQLGMIKVFG